MTVTPAGSDGQITALRGAVSNVTEQHERRRELKQLLRTVSDCVVKLNREGEFVFANERARKVLGVDSERVVGRAYDDPDWDLRGPDGHPIPEEELPFRQIQETEAPVYGEKLSIRWPDGPRKLLVVNGAPLFDKDSAFDGAVFSLTDATGIQERQRELKSERRFISQLLDAFEELFYVLNPDGTIRRWNDRIVEVMDYTVSELDGMSATEMFPSGEQEKIGDAIEQALCHGHATVEAEILTGDGGRVPYEWTGTRVTDADGEATGVVGIGRDLSERRQRERRFRALVEGSSDSISIVDADGQFQYQS